MLISYRLEGDAGNPNRRSFYTYRDPGEESQLWYRNPSYSRTAVGIGGTKGLVGLRLEYVDQIAYPKLIKVTATATKVIKGTRSAPYTISVQYSDFVYLRNA